MAVHSLGSFTFVNFHQPGNPASGPEMLQEQTDITQRPGVHGTGVFLLGIKAMPFQMRSLVDVSSLNNGHSLIAQYHQVIGSDPLELTWHGVNYHSAFGVKYMPLRLNGYRLQRIITGVGGLSGSPAATVEALWTLIPISSA